MTLATLPLSHPFARSLTATLQAAAIGSILGAGAIFGFFYAWVCSTMWGLDTAPPAVAIEAMQAMNASVRNGVFAASFFGTPVILCMTAALALSVGNRRAAGVFSAAAMLYVMGGFLVTMGLAVPMNQALGEIALPLSQGEAAAIWADYSPRWQLINITRTIACGGVLVLTGIGYRQI